MVFAANAVAIVPADIEQVLVDRVVAKRVGVPAHGFLADFGQAYAFNGRRCSREVFRDQLGRQTHCIEDLRAAVGLVGRDAHLGHHLQHAFADGLDVVLLHVFFRELHALALTDLFQRLERQIGVHCLGAVAGQRAEVMDLARFACLDHEAHLHPKALTTSL